MDIRARFFDKTIPEPNTGCWLWLGPLNELGYGRASLMGKRRLAHRASYEMTKGPIPAGLEIDHICRVRCCVNPDHLEPVTSRENSLRAIRRLALAGLLPGAATDTHCMYGHELRSAGQYSAPHRGVGCMQCARLSRQRHYHSIARTSAERVA